MAAAGIEVPPCFIVVCNNTSTSKLVHDFIAGFFRDTGQREAYRRFLHSTIVPLARLVQRELSEKFDADVSLSFDSLFAGDLSGRARAFQSLVKDGMDLAKAAALAGVMESDDG